MSRAVVIVVLALTVLGGCGSSSSSEDGTGEAAEVAEQLKSLEKGEILIQGVSSPRTYGPYVFKEGGYVLHYEQPNAKDGADEPLTVALQSKRDSRQQPYELVVDSPQHAGKKDMSLSGKLYVHVESSSGEYVLRFRPKPSGGG